MSRQYSDCPLTLALDTGSPVTSVAVGRGAEILAHATAPGGRSSGSLLAHLDGLLKRHELNLDRLERLVAARGPGSFTGLRVGLATALGLHQSLDLPATAVSSLRALARAVSDAAGGAPVVAVVDALRGQWFAQPWATGSGLEPLGPPAIREPEELLAWAPCVIAGMGLDRLPPAVAGDRRVRVETVAALAPALLQLAADGMLDWDPARLISPLYLRAPAAAGAG